jgi:hypothetical protein
VKLNLRLVTVATFATFTMMAVRSEPEAQAAPGGDGVPAQLRALTEAVESLTRAAAVADKRIAELERQNDALTRRLRCVSTTSTGNDIIFEGCNVHVRNGLGQTPTTNGYGNLIVGYNKNEVSTRTGSHNVILGDLHEYTSYGGLVSGTENTLTAPNASILSSVDSEAHTTGGTILGADRGMTDTAGVIVGGSMNYVGPDAHFAVTVGGYQNAVNGEAAVAAAGTLNNAQGARSLVAAGSENQSLGAEAAICGGSSNSSSGLTSSVSGGSHNAATGRSSSVSGGYSNTASGDYSSILGGNGVTVAASYGTSP